MGPWIETKLDLDAAQTSVSVNGVVTTHYKTNDMLFGIATFISTMTRYLTLHPGDVIWMGTDGSSPDLNGLGVASPSLPASAGEREIFLGRPRPA